MKITLVAFFTVAFALWGGYLTGYRNGVRDRDIMWQKTPIYVDSHGTVWRGKNAPYVTDISVNIKANRLTSVSSVISGK